jgi:hypothetical protein
MSQRDFVKGSVDREGQRRCMVRKMSSVRTITQYRGRNGELGINPRRSRAAGILASLERISYL